MRTSSRWVRAIVLVGAVAAVIVWAGCGRGEGPRPDPAGAGRAKLRGDQAYDAGSLDLARRAYEEALGLDPGLVPARFNLGLVHLRARRGDLAVRELQQVLVARPGQTDVLYNLALALAQAGQKDAALSRLEEVVAADPAHASAHRELGFLLLRFGQQRRAIVHLRKAADRIDDLTLLLGLAHLEEQAGERESARRQYARACALAPSSAEALIGLARVLIDSAALDEAVRLLEPALARHPNLAAARFFLGRALRRRGDLARALDLLREALRLGFGHPVPSSPDDSWLEIGLALLALGRTDEAVAYLSSAAAKGVDLPAALDREDGRISPASRAAALARLRAPSPPRQTTKLRFTEEAAARGLTFTHRTTRPLFYLPQIFGPGVALLDADGDGTPDVYLPASGEGLVGEVGRLYRNLGGRFEDVTEACGVGLAGWDMGAIAADLDGDGYPDLFVTGYRRLHVLWNEGDGTFRTERLAAHEDRLFFTGACAVDADLDGRLDLYCGTYSDWDADRPEVRPEIVILRNSIQHLKTLIPQAYAPQPNRLLRNVGARRFVDATREMGTALDEGRTMGVMAVDADLDGRPDILVAEDSSPNAILVNRGGRFVDLAARLWLNDARGSMGLAAGDILHRGRLDLFVTNWYREDNGLFLASERGPYRDVAVESGLSETDLELVCWGTTLCDLDDDGELDLVYVAGHTSTGSYEDPAYLSHRGPLLPQPTRAWRGLGQARFESVGARWGLTDRDLNGRGLATGDVDADGGVDLVVGVNNDRARLYLNRGPRGHWLDLSLVGTRSNRSAVGTTVTIHAGGVRRLAQLTAGASYLSSHEPVLHFGLGGHTRVDSLEVRWPSGRLTRMGPVAADRKLRIVEPP